MANARLNGLVLAHIHKPTEIDSSSVLGPDYVSRAGPVTRAASVWAGLVVM